MRLKILVLLFIFFMSVTTVQCETITAMKKCQYDDPYLGIYKLSIIQEKNKEVSVKLFETGGGDPAMNGNFLVLTIAQWSNDGYAYSWYTNINIYEVKSFKVKGDKIKITGTEHRMIDGEIKTASVKITITYSVNASGELSDKINIVKK